MEVAYLDIIPLSVAISLKRAGSLIVLPVAGHLQAMKTMKAMRTKKAEKPKQAMKNKEGLKSGARPAPSRRPRNAKASSSVMDLYHWPEFPGQPISPDIFRKCRRIIFTPEEFRNAQATMIAAGNLINSSEGWGGWTEEALVDAGFQMVSRPTLLAVAEADGGFAIQFVYLPGQPQLATMQKLAEAVFDSHGEVKGHTQGQSFVTQRGGQNPKTMSGVMLMYGLKCQPHNREYAKKHGLCCTAVPCFYNLACPRDETLEQLWRDYLVEVSALERVQVPACAAHRECGAVRCDPQSKFRLAPQCNAFAVSFTSDFAIQPHDDSGGCEAITFMNRDGPPPKGKRNEWAFAVAGHILRLPASRGATTSVYLRGTGLWHGTLPTSYKHNNHGSALVSKTATLEHLERHSKLRARRCRAGH